MNQVRSFVSMALELRLKSGIKVRQPLNSVSFKETVGEEYFDTIKDEINVKSLYVNKEQTDDVILDTVITDDLRVEGEMRELLRALQDERKKIGLMPKDRARAYIPNTDVYQKILSVYKKEIMNTASLENIEYSTESIVSVVKV